MVKILPSKANVPSIVWGGILGATLVSVAYRGLAPWLRKLIMP